VPTLSGVSCCPQLGRREKGERKEEEEERRRRGREGGGRGGEGEGGGRGRRREMEEEGGGGEGGEGEGGEGEGEGRESEEEEEDKEQEEESKSTGLIFSKFSIISQELTSLMQSIFLKTRASSDFICFFVSSAKFLYGGISGTGLFPW
jgi:hypothetical protein